MSRKNAARRATIRTRIAVLQGRSSQVRRADAAAAYRAAPGPVWGAETDSGDQHVTAHSADDAEWQLLCLGYELRSAAVRLA